MTTYSPLLDFPITLPFVQVDQLTRELLLREIECVLQSYEEIILNETLKIEITHVAMPTGEEGK